MEIDETTIDQVTNTEKKEEVEMLKEFERRRKFESISDIVDRIEKDESVPNNKRLKPKQVDKNKALDTLELVFKPREDLNETFNPA
jgi:hypothetical protein